MHMYLHTCVHIHIQTHIHITSTHMQRKKRGKGTIIDWKVKDQNDSVIWNNEQNQQYDILTQNFHFKIGCIKCTNDPGQ